VSQSFIPPKENNSHAGATVARHQHSVYLLYWLYWYNSTCAYLRQSFVQEEEENSKAGAAVARNQHFAVFRIRHVRRAGGLGDLAVVCDEVHVFAEHQLPAPSYVSICQHLSASVSIRQHTSPGSTSAARGGRRRSLPRVRLDGRI
jgi:hypothetical protein